MDSSGNIYSVEQMRRELDAMGIDDPRREEFERRIAEDEGRMDGYLRGRSDAELKDAWKDMRAKVEAAQKELDG